MPRITTHRKQCSNPEYNSVEDYFKSATTIPFLDHLTSDLSDRFDSHTKQAALVQKLLPMRITSESSVCNNRDAVAL